MPSEKLKIRFQEIERLSLAAGLEPFDVHFFEVPSPVIWQTAAYGLPTRYSHWSFGRSYEFQKHQGEMGFSKIYELILNNNPSIAYLDSTNTDTVNLLIAAHCQGHSSFFRNNIMFIKSGETHMIDVASQHAAIIDQFRNDYGDDVVDDWLDIALSLEQHIDVYKGRHRKKYPGRQISIEHRKVLPWEDLNLKNDPLSVKKIKGIHIPPCPEKDILWFLSEYANLEDWQKKIFEIVRRESYYFFPAFKTKIINEGFASYWHAEIMKQYALGDNNDYGVKDIQYPLTDEEHLDFVAYHEKVVQPGLKIPLKIKTKDATGKDVKVWNPKVNSNIFSAATRLNPYYVGFKIFRDIKERWDKYYEQGYMENEWGEKINVDINGTEKVLQVAYENDDVSFLRNYLTDELASELKLFVYGSTKDYNDNYDIQENIQKGDYTSQEVKNKTVGVRSKDKKLAIEAIAKVRNNYGAPNIVIRRIDDNGVMRLEHTTDDDVNLDMKYAEHVLEYIYKAWRRPIELIRKDKLNNKTRLLIYNGMKFESDFESYEYPEILENNDIPSSW